MKPLKEINNIKFYEGEDGRIYKETVEALTEWGSYEEFISFETCGLELNKIYNMDCLDGLKQMQDECVDLTIISPPYDDLRKYNGYSWDFESIAKELYRVTKQGGVVVWVVGDKTVKGSETLTSFKQALIFQEIGFNVHDVMIYKKKNKQWR